MNLLAADEAEKGANKGESATFIPHESDGVMEKPL